MAFKLNRDRNTESEEVEFTGVVDAIKPVGDGYTSTVGVVSAGTREDVSLGCDLSPLVNPLYPGGITVGDQVRVRGTRIEIRGEVKVLAVSFDRAC